MLKNKYVVWTGLSLIVIGLLAGVFVLWQVKQRDGIVDLGQESLHETAISVRTPNAEQPQKSATGAASGGLNVGSSSAGSSLGQLGATGRAQSSGGASGSGSSGSSSSPFDPATFGQYEKHKDATGALFGDAQVGNGAELIANKKAAVLYRGWLTNGQMFDESRTGADGKMQPFIFTIGEHKVIPGWEQGLSGMKVGGVRLLVVPPALGYGAAGQGSIPPNSVLVFQVQLLEVQ